MMQVKIERTNEEGFSDQTSVYHVDTQYAATVLQVLHTVFRKYEPTLSYRYSCGIGLCGTCTTMINGKPTLSCMKIAEQGADGCLHIAPLPKGRTLKDLVKE
jgi:succinate dehydrogenase/fumarate reductase-like Fe-S protein